MAPEGFSPRAERAFHDLDKTVVHLDSAVGCLDHTLGRLDNVVGHLGAACGYLDDTVDHFDKAVGELDDSLDDAGDALVEVDDALHDLGAIRDDLDDARAASDGALGRWAEAGGGAETAIWSAETASQPVARGIFGPETCGRAPDSSEICRVRSLCRTGF